MSRTSSRVSFHRATALVLLVSLLSPGLALARQQGSVTGGSSFEQSVMPSFFTSFSQSFGMLFGMLQGQQASGQDMPPRERPVPERKAAELPPSKAEREAKVGSIKLDLDGDLTIESGVRRILMAIPLDKDGDPIHGLLAEWESSDKNTISITKDGRAVAGNSGKAKLTARAGQKQVSLQVTVTEPAKVQPNSAVGETKTTDSLRAAKEARRHKHHPRFVSPTPQEGQSSGFGYRLPDSEATSLYWAQNDVGAPPGRTEPGAATPPAAIAGTETPLSSNFAFGVPLVNLPGRGIDIKLALSYNSRLWHKSIDSGSATRMTYDVDSGWPAPGFRLGYGYIESHGAAGITLVDADGTRHELRKATTSYSDVNYYTVDGTFIHFTSSHPYYPTQGWAEWSDGTRVYYYSGNGAWATMSYPVQIMDRNGNYILISYLGWGLINSITDTLGRYISFGYEYDQSQGCSSGNSQCFHNARKLVSIGVPGRQAVRLYYDTIPINQAGSFTVATRAPATARVIRYVYFPDKQSGFRYDYSSYGMIAGVKQLRGMTVSTTTAYQQGTVTSEGQIAATSNYNYPQTPANLSDAPAFTQRTDDWAGRTSAPSIYNFSVNQAAGTSTITAPNGTITTTQSTAAQGSWNDGLVTDITQQGGGLTVTAHNTWEPDSAGVNPRLQQTQVTNQANQTRTTQFTYTTYNNVSVIRELGFNNEELRRTETTYETHPSWTRTGNYPGPGNSLLRLPTSVKIFAGGAAQPAARVDYAYDQYAFDQAFGLTGRNGLVMHDEVYDPYSESGPWKQYFRGNLTSSTRYINAADPNQGTIVDTKAYDIAGNLVSQTANCCRQKAYDYFSGYYFANVTQMTQGDTQHQQNAIYDFNTGLMTQSTDQNGQVTNYEYYPGSLRLYRVTRPDGGYTIVEYGDLLYADPDQSHLHSWTKTSTLIEGTVVAEEWKYFDGRGQLVRTFGTQTTQGRATRDIEYDAMGRAVRDSNPYYSQSGAGSAINPASLWATRQYDSLSRVTQQTLPDQTSALAAYAGNVMTVTDQANKSRRRVTDALGRLVRIDEPDASGNLGSVNSPLQPTSYQYDALDNLIHITQGAQHRYFKYDSLSRMTYERQPEQDAPHAAADALTGNSSWSRKIDYNGFSLVSQVTDARGVATNFTYDTLNRLISKTYSDGTPAVQYIHDEARYPDGGGEAYSNRGRLTTVSTGNNQFYQQFNYNRMGKVVMQRQIAGGNPFEIQYSYNPGGQLIEEWIRGEPPDLWPSYLTAYSLDEKRSYFYDAAGRRTSVNRGSHSAPQAAYASALSYNASSALESLTYGNGAVETRSYNSRLQVDESESGEGWGGIAALRLPVWPGQSGDRISGCPAEQRAIGTHGCIHRRHAPITHEAMGRAVQLRFAGASGCGQRVSGR